MAVSDSLLEAVEARSGEVVDPNWLDTTYAYAMAFVRLLAPCKKTEWSDFDSLPADVASVVVAALARQAINPRGIRQETIGEYSYTLAGVSGNNPAGPFTGDERRIITASSGCGGVLKSVKMTTPEILPLDEPEVIVTNQDADWQRDWVL